MSDLTQVMLFKVASMKEFIEAEPYLDGCPVMIGKTNVLSEEDFLKEEALAMEYEFIIWDESIGIPDDMQRMILWVQDGWTLLFDEGG